MTYILDSKSPIPFINDGAILTTEEMDTSTMPMMQMMQAKPKENFIVRSFDNITFHLYFDPKEKLQRPTYINKLCRFLDTRNSSQTVYFHLGSQLDETTWYEIGAIISCIFKCKAVVIMSADGACSSTESMLWLFGTERVVGKYGQLYFSLGSLKYSKLGEYKPYIDLFLKRAKELCILTEEQINSMITKNKDFCFFGDDFNNRNTTSITPINGTDIFNFKPTINKISSDNTNIENDTNSDELVDETIILPNKEEMNLTLEHLSFSIGSKD